MAKIHRQVLDQTRQKLLNQLSFLKGKDFYLAGGTALALQLGHRTSIDFDFYTLQKFDPHQLLRQLKSKLNLPLQSLFSDEETLRLLINGVETSFFFYPYQLIAPLVEYSRGVELAALPDLAAMKAVAIVQRAKKRDFYDFYYLLTHTFSLEKILSFVSQKYPEYDFGHILVALVYFEEVEKDNEEERIRLLGSWPSWEEIKRRIIDEVRNYQLKSARE